MSEYRITFLSEFLRTHRHTHLYVSHIPFSPGSAIHPYPTVLEPLCPSLLLLIDGSKHGVSTLTMRAMRVGKVGCHIYLMWLNLRDKFLNRYHILLRHRQLLDLSTLIERQVEEMDMLAVDAIILTCQTSLTTTDKSLQTQYLFCVEITFLLGFQEVLHHLIAVLDNLVRAIGEDGVKAVDEMHETTYLLIAHSDIT